MSFIGLSDAIDAHARRAPERPAILYGDDAWTYGELARRIDCLTEALSAHGIVADDRVAWLGLNHPEQLVLLAALMRLSAILVPLNYRLAAPELRTIVEHAGASLLVVDPMHAALAAQLGVCAVVARDSLVDSRADAGADARIVPSASVSAADDRVETSASSLAPVTPDTPALLVYTSGTTGQPKGAIHTNGGLHWNALASIAMHDMSADDRVLTVLPLFHVGGLCIQTIPALYAGARVVLHPRFDPSAWLDAVALERLTISLMVPATMRSVIEHPRWLSTDLGSLRILGAGSSTIPDPLIEAFHARGVPVCQIYGATETGPVSIVLRTEEAWTHVGVAGKPALGCEIRLRDDEGRDVADDAVGEICVRGPNVMAGYWQESDHPSFADGWFRTGDSGWRDADGFYTVVGRAQDLIISGGENIYPAEIENVLGGIPEIAEAAVLGIPDAKWGEVPVAVVVLRPGQSIAEAEIRTHCDDRLARFKHPRRILFRATLPRNAMGKVTKRALFDELHMLDVAGEA